MAWTTPVTDRVLADAIAVKNGDMSNTKGQLSAEVLTHISGNIQQLHYWILWYDYFSENGFFADARKIQPMIDLAPAYSTKQSWTNDEMFGETELQTLYTQLTALRTYPVKETTPAVPNIFDGFSYETLNTIEQILADVYEIFVCTWNGANRLGTYICGDTSEFRL